MGRASSRKRGFRDRKAAGAAIIARAERLAAEHTLYPPDAADRYRAIAAWGIDPAEVQQEADRIAAELGVATPVRILRGDAGAFAGLPAAYWSPDDNALLINDVWWNKSAGYERLDAIAHEVFHAHQIALIQRAKRGDLREDDPLYSDAVRRGGRTAEDLFNPSLVDPGDKLANYERYRSHPFEDDGFCYGYAYVERRFSELKG